MCVVFVVVVLCVLSMTVVLFTFVLQQNPSLCFLRPSIKPAREAAGSEKLGLNGDFRIEPCALSVVQGASVEGARSTWPLSFCSNTLRHQGFTSCDTYFGDPGNSSGQGVGRGKYSRLPPQKEFGGSADHKGSC